MLLCLSTGAGGSGDPQAALARAAAASGIPYGAHLPPGFPGAAGHPPGLNIPTSSAGGAGGGGEMPAHIMAALAARPDMDPRELLSMQHVSAALVSHISHILNTKHCSKKISIGIQFSYFAHCGQLFIPLNYS